MFSLCFSCNSAEAGSLGKILKAAGKASRIYRKNAADEGALTEEMLEKCILLKQAIDTTGADAKILSEKLEALQKELDELKGYLEKNKGTIDPTKTDVVAAYNQKIDRYKKMADEYETLRKEYNGKVDPYQQKVDQFDKECKGQPYYEDDYQKVVNKLGYGM